MELEISYATGIRFVDCFRDAGQRPLQSLEVGCSCTFRREADSLAFDGDARFHHVVDQIGLLSEREGEEVVQHRDIGSSDNSADAVADLDDAENCEGSQSLANDRPTDAKLRRELSFRPETVARLQ